MAVEDHRHPSACAALRKDVTIVTAFRKTFTAEKVSVIKHAITTLIGGTIGYRKSFKYK
jgi:hypothetical protein